MKNLRLRKNLCMRFFFRVAWRGLENDGRNIEDTLPNLDSANHMGKS